MKDRYWGLISLARVCGMDMGATASLSPHNIWIGNSSFERLSSHRGSNLQIVSLYGCILCLHAISISFTLICQLNRKLFYETDIFHFCICWWSPYWLGQASSSPHFDNLGSKLIQADVCQIFHQNLCHPVYRRVNWTLDPSMNSIESKMLDWMESKVDTMHVKPD